MQPRVGHCNAQAIWLHGFDDMSTGETQGWLVGWLHFSPLCCSDFPQSQLKMPNQYQCNFYLHTQLMSSCVCAIVCVCLSVRACLCGQVPLYVGMSENLCVRLCVCFVVSLHYIFTYKCMCVCVCVCVCLCVYVCLCACVFVHCMRTSQRSSQTGRVKPLFSEGEKRNTKRIIKILC